ncbi:MAG: hypothetical protein QOG88_1282 [Actinomycetota bacterium]|nr:hypothetical protein [Actinomycetota bacterium]
MDEPAVTQGVIQPVQAGRRPRPKRRVALTGGNGAYFRLIFGSDLQAIATSRRGHG